MSSKKNILKFKIEDIKSFKAIIETLVKIVTEITWVIYSPKDDKFKGIEMSVSDPSRSVFKFQNTEGGVEKDLKASKCT